MDDRQKTLLGQIIKAYLKTAMPVGSKMLEAKSSLGVSSATIRNEMAQLEQAGYISQPHTSAGRIPTALGYNYFIQHCLKSLEPNAREKQELKQILNSQEDLKIELKIKDLAKKLADFSQNAVIVGFSSDDVYYTGLANIFSQPEFRNPALICDFGSVIDELGQVMEEIFSTISQVEVKVGKQNPFGQATAAILCPWKIKSKTGIMGILGPLRMDYERNLGLINFVKQHI